MEEIHYLPANLGIKKERLPAPFSIKAPLGKHARKAHELRIERLRIVDCVE